jgi:predicted ATPase
MAGPGVETRDYRQDGCAPRGSVYFEGPDANAKLDQHVQAYGAPVHKDLPLPLGRMMPVTVRVRCPTATSPIDECRALDMSFRDLCVAGRGVPDYAAILDFVDCVVIRDLPALDSMDEDPARRLVILIDLCYDRKKLIMLSSEHTPKDVFASLRHKYDADRLAGSEALEREQDEEFGQIRSTAVGGSSGGLTPLVRAPGAGPEAHPEAGWVEWSATGLKKASMHDLTVHTDRQLHDRMLPLLRCQSRLQEMFVSGMTADEARGFKA